MDRFDAENNRVARALHGAAMKNASRPNGGLAWRKQ
jgi:hypothetical protein